MEELASEREAGDSIELDSAGRAQRSAAGAKFALLLFAVQLVLNTGWSVVFFGMHAIGAAFAEMLLWWMMTVATTVAFSSLSFLAAWLLIPYVVWVAFASYLNFRIWQLN